MRTERQPVDRPGPAGAQHLDAVVEWSLMKLDDKVRISTEQQSFFRRSLFPTAVIKVDKNESGHMAHRAIVQHERRREVDGNCLIEGVV